MRCVEATPSRWSSAHPVISAMALGQVDYHLYNPWHPLERILYPAVSEFLAAWDKSQDAPMVPVRIVGTRSAARSHELRDTLTRVGVPFWFYEPDTPTGEELLTEAGVAPRNCRSSSSSTARCWSTLPSPRSGVRWACEPRSTPNPATSW
jgi:hypothetical protein